MAKRSTRRTVVDAAELCGEEVDAAELCGEEVDAADCSRRGGGPRLWMQPEQVIIEDKIKYESDLTTQERRKSVDR